MSLLIQVSASLGYENTDYESEPSLCFSSYLLQWTESFFSPQSAQVHIEILNELRIFFWLKANLVPT